MRIVFMGTPDFAVPPLRALIDAGHEVAAVFTQPDKPQGRKLLLTPPPVKVLAQAEKIQIFQPATLKNEKAALKISEINPDAIVVAAYGKILPKTILSIPRFGCINIHASLLPKYRGAGPVQAAILNGESHTGVTAMHMAEGVDTGDILLSESTPIGRDETAQTLTARLSKLGADLIVRTLAAVQAGTVHPVAQDDKKSCHAPMVSKKMSPIDWKRSADEIHNQVRGLYPWPGASASFRNRRLKICRSRVADNMQGLPGMAVIQEGKFYVCCGKRTALELLEVQLDGGRKMSGTDFLRGHPAQGVILT